MIYPGIRNHRREMPVTTRSMENPIARAIAIERLSLMDLPGIAPALTSSICFSSTATAGSAEMINHPRSMDRGIRIHRIGPEASSAPSTEPREENPTFTPVRKNTSPT